MQLSHDPEADVVYIELSPARRVRAETLSDQLTVDYDAEGNAVGVAIGSVSFGIDLDRLPRHLEMPVGRLLEEFRFKVFAH